MNFHLKIMAQLWITLIMFATPAFAADTIKIGLAITISGDLTT